MAKLVIDIPVNLEKIKPKSCPLRRNSTGNSIIIFSEPKPIPNYLRASIGSCHDFCKYGVKREFQDNSRSSLSPKQDQNENMVLEERSKTNYRGKKVSPSTKLVPVSSSRQQPSELKQKPLVRSHQSPVKQPNKTSLKSANNTRISRNDAGKGIRTSKASKKSSSLPLTSSSSVKVPTAKIGTSKRLKKVSQLEIKKSVEKSETCKKTSYENVPERIIHVIESNDENRNEGLAQESYHCTALSSRPNQKQKMDSAAENRSTATRVERVIPEEKDSSPNKLKFQRDQKVLEIKNGNADGFKNKSLKRVVSDGNFIHKKNDSIRTPLLRQAAEQKNMYPDLMNTVIEETASKLVTMSNSKVKALVDAFETLINIQESENSRTY